MLPTWVIVGEVVRRVSMKYRRSVPLLSDFGGLECSRNGAHMNVSFILKQVSLFSCLP